MRESVRIYPGAEVGQVLKVYVKVKSAPAPIVVEGVVHKIKPTAGVMYVKLKLEDGMQLEVPPMDACAETGTEYVLLGAPNPSHPSCYSVSQGRISSTVLERDNVIFGDSVTNSGDSGGGCFALQNGRLIAINLGMGPEGKTVLKPVAAVLELLYMAGRFRAASSNVIAGFIRPRTGGRRAVWTGYAVARMSKDTCHWAFVYMARLDKAVCTLTGTLQSPYLRR